MTPQQFLTADQKMHAENRVHAHSDFDSKFQTAKELSVKLLPPNVSKFRRQFVTMAILGFQCQATACWEPAQYYRRPDIPEDLHGIAPGSRTAKDVSWERLKAAIPDHWGWCSDHYRLLTYELPSYEIVNKQYQFFLDPTRSRFTYGTQEDVDALLRQREFIQEGQRYPWEPWEGSTDKDKRDHERFQNHMFSVCIWFPYPADHKLRTSADLGYSR